MQHVERVDRDDWIQDFQGTAELQKQLEFHKKNTMYPAKIEVVYIDSVILEV
jgi:hypothetical protein